MRRPLLLVAVMVCAAGLLTACGPRNSRSVVGMSVDDAGAPVIVLQNCDGNIAQLEFYDLTQPRPDSNTLPRQRVGAGGFRMSL